MQHGELGTGSMTPRILIQWEGVVAMLPDGYRMGYLVGGRRNGRTRRYIDAHIPQPHVAKVIWDWVWRRDYRAELFTLHLPAAPATRDALEHWVDEHSLPLAHCHAWTPDEFSRRLSYMPDVYYVVHAEHGRPVIAGNRSIYVNDPGALNL